MSVAGGTRACRRGVVAASTVVWLAGNGLPGTIVSLLLSSMFLVKRATAPAAMTATSQVETVRATCRFRR